MPWASVRQIHGLAFGDQHKAELGQNEFLTAGVDGALDGYGLWTQAMSTAQTPQTLGNGKAFFWLKSARLTRTDQRVRIPTTLLPPHG